MQARKSKLVIIPTYKEIENIEAISRAVLALEDGFDILVIDDGSPDGTADKGKELQQEFPGYTRSKDYKYGKTLLTLYTKEEALEE